MFGKKSKLRYIDAYYSKISNKEILPWHTDQAYSGKMNISNFNNPNDFCEILVKLMDNDIPSKTSDPIKKDSKFGRWLKSVCKRDNKPKRGGNECISAPGKICAWFPLCGLTGVTGE